MKQAARPSYLTERSMDVEHTEGLGAPLDWLKHNDPSILLGSGPPGSRKDRLGACWAKQSDRELLEVSWGKILGNCNYIQAEEVFGYINRGTILTIREIDRLINGESVGLLTDLFNGSRTQPDVSLYVTTDNPYDLAFGLRSMLTANVFFERPQDYTKHQIFQAACSNHGVPDEAVPGFGTDDWEVLDEVTENFVDAELEHIPIEATQLSGRADPAFDDLKRAAEALSPVFESDDIEPSTRQAYIPNHVPTIFADHEP